MITPVSNLISQHPHFQQTSGSKKSPRRLLKATVKNSLPMIKYIERTFSEVYLDRARTFINSYRETSLLATYKEYKYESRLAERRHCLYFPLLSSFYFKQHSQSSLKIWHNWVCAQITPRTQSPSINHCQQFQRSNISKQSINIQKEQSISM